jgi:hypothetical protein
LDSPTGLTDWIHEGSPAILTVAPGQLFENLAARDDGPLYPLQDAHDEWPHHLWLVRGHGDGGVLRARRPASGIHSCIRDLMSVGVGVWISTRRMAVRRSRSGLVGDCRSPVVEGRLIRLTILRQATQIEMPACGYFLAAERFNRFAKYSVQASGMAVVATAFRKRTWL